MSQTEKMPKHQTAWFGFGIERIYHNVLLNNELQLPCPPSLSNQIKLK